MDEAATHFLRAHELAPDDPQLAHNAVVACIRAQRFAEAAAALRAAKGRGLALDPRLEAELPRSP
jgi:hypothetical protein